MDVDKKEIELLKNLYWDQRAAIRIDGTTSDFVKVKRGVRQGCVLSPDLFSLYTEMIMRHIKELEGIRVGGVNLNNLRYADDTALFADSEEKLQKIVEVVVEESKKLGLEINIEKTVVLACSKKTKVPKCNIVIDGMQLKQVDNFKYLGSVVTSDSKSEKDIKMRIGTAKAAFRKMEKVLCARTMKMATRLRLLKCYVWSVMLYGSESWTISKNMQARLEAAEMWCLRRMMKIPWMKKVSNQDVLRKAGTGRELLSTVMKRQSSFLGHVLRKEKMEHLVLTGKIEGRRARGCQRLTFLDWIARHHASGRRIDVIRDCVDRTIAANVRI